MPNRPDERKERADQVSALLKALESGELTADSPSERRLRRRLEGAASALEALEETGSSNGG
jgi:hypothetical protein